MLSKNQFLSFAVFVVAIWAGASAQAPDILWMKDYGGAWNDEAWQLKQTPDGGFIIVGFSEDNDDIYLLKTNENGDTLWTSLLGFTSDDVGRSVEPLEDGGYILTGHAGGYIVLMKADSLGNHIWHHYLESGWGRAVRVTGDGGFIVAGFVSVEGNGLDIYLAKTNSDGDTIWSRTYGGTNPERPWDVRETSDGGFIVLGWTESYGLGNSDIYAIKTNADGDTLWTRTYGSSGADEGRSLVLKEDGGFVLAGKIYDSATNSDIAIINADANGDTIWTRIFPDEETEIANSIEATSDGNYILTGMIFGPDYMYSAFIMKIDAQGDSLWSRHIYDSGQNLYLRSIVQTSDGGYVAAGYHQVPGNYNDVFLVKLAPDITGIDEEVAVLPDKISLHQNYPNPFNAKTSISFELSRPGDITLTIYDLLGRKISVLTDGFYNAGSYCLTFDGSGLTSGVYFCRIAAGDKYETRTMVLLK
jgi:hypothetical protein